MLRRGSWARALVGLSALALIASGCGAEEHDDAAEAAPVEAIDEPDDAAAGTGAEDLATEPEAPDDATGTGAEAEPVDRQVTAYVVAYHWGWAIFDEDGNELDVLEVPVGTEVELVAVNDHASGAIEQLPDPVAATIQGTDWHEQAHHAVEMGRIPDPTEAEGISLSQALGEAHGHGHDLDHHELMVTGVGATAFLDSHADEPERLVFTVEDEGVHEFRCLHECGFGHEAQRWEMLVVTA